MLPESSLLIGDRDLAADAARLAALVSLADLVQVEFAVNIEVDGIRIDPPYEKLTTLVSRCEIRDLVDLMLLEQAGHPTEDALDDALAKDGGCTPAALAWTLSRVEISEQAELPVDVSPSEMRAYLARLITRLRRAARPDENRP